MRQRHARPEQVDAAALVERLAHVDADLVAEEAAELDLRDHGAGERLRQPHGVADVVVVAVGDEDRVDALRLELRGGAGRVAGQEGIDVDPLARGVSKRNAAWPSQVSAITPAA